MLMPLCTVLTDHPVNSGSTEDAEETRICLRQRRSVKKSVLVNKRIQGGPITIDLGSFGSCFYGTWPTPVFGRLGHGRPSGEKGLILWCSVFQLIPSILEQIRKQDMRGNKLC